MECQKVTVVFSASAPLNAVAAKAAERTSDRTFFMTRGRLPGCEAIRRKEPAVLLNMNGTKKGGNVH